MVPIITREEIQEIQEKWASGLVGIGKSYIEKRNFQKAAAEHVQKLYGYGEETVLFKPTMANNKQFRKTFEAALSYFIGGNPEFPNDVGFALKPWKDVRFENSDFILKERYAIAMGNYFFTDYEGSETKVEYTFGFYRDENQKLKIHLHHSSVPYKRT
ncbi:hypothetical protein K5G00_06630 [Maribellus maritimus]|nr:hypothetical protein [Maribellus maritimus]